MKRTPNYGLPIVENNDRYSKEEQNSTMSIIDSELHGMSETLKNIDIEGNAEIIREIVDARNNETTLKNRLDKVDSKINEVSMSLENIENNTSSYINVKEFGAKGDGVTDDTQAIQNCFIYAYRNKKSIDIPNGTYIISKPIIIYGSSNELSGGLRVKGESTELTVFKASSNFQSYGLGCDYTDISAMFILLNENFLTNDNELIGSNESNMKHDILLQDFKILGENNIDYGIWTNNCAYSTFKRLRIRFCNIAGLTNSGENISTNFYLNTVEKVRVDSCPTSFLFGRGVNTSVKFDSCYSVSATKCGYRIQGIYMSMINNCIDNCTGTCFDLIGYRGSVINPGSESDRALCTFKGGQYTNVIITGGLLYGNYDNDEAKHIICEAGGHMTFEGVTLAFDKTETGKTLPGYLYTQDYLSYVNIGDCKFPNYLKNDNTSKDLTQRSYYKDKFGQFNTRHKQDLKYIGYDTHDSNNEYMKNANAIYFGMGSSLGWLNDGTDVRWAKPANEGDLCLIKQPKTNLACGYVNTTKGKGFTSEGTVWHRIPIIYSDTVANIKAMDSTKIANGTQVFATDLGKPVWKKNTNIWVTADGTQI